MRLPSFVGQRPETSSLRERILSQRVYPTEVLRKIVRKIDAPAAWQAIPTEDQRHFVLTSFTLGCVSILAAFFPICGFPVSITGLLLGLYGRQATPLKTTSAWAIVLSLIGLLLTCINTLVILSIYFQNYL
ncbi:hypothetical protein [Dictyobacter alpinus]|uniref:hypothetical protein n=1 Tax=Dictyobacter alpinus TaxID=2014873 RepID=UPI000F83DC01|nr:hypothetical protein [Dictyobacter alpinus]